MTSIKFNLPATVTPRHNPAGLFFCLAPAEGAGLLFCPYTIHPHTSIYSAFCIVHAVIPPTPQNSAQGFTWAFPLIRPIPAHTIQQSHKPPIHHLRHVGGHTVKRNTSTNTKTQPPRRTLYRSAQPPYYNKVYKGAAVRTVMDPCPAVQHSADHASPAPSTRRGSPAAGAWRNNWRLAAASLFGLSPDSQ